MIQDIYPKHYQVEYAGKTPEPKDLVFAFCGHFKREHKLLLGREESGKLTCPTVEQVEKAGIGADKLQYLFSIDEQAYFLLKQFTDETDAWLPDGFSYEPMRTLRCCNPQDLCFAGMTAYQLFDWYRINRFCGCCGSSMEHFGPERAMRCPSCGNLVFPKICPAVIVGVIHPYYDENGNRCKDKDQIVITRYAGREYKGVALIAGFCEIGERVEDTVAREVMEEVGLKVRNITYYNSQPWGFDSNLLLGFFCEVDGDITIVRDEKELAIAEWADRATLVNTQENLLALTGTMIDEFVKGWDFEQK